MSRLIVSKRRSSIVGAHDAVGYRGFVTPPAQRMYTARLWTRPSGAPSPPSLSKSPSCSRKRYSSQPNRSRKNRSTISGAGSLASRYVHASSESCGSTCHVYAGSPASARSWARRTSSGLDCGHIKPNLGRSDVRSALGVVEGDADVGGVDVGSSTSSSGVPGCQGPEAPRPNSRTSEPSALAIARPGRGPSYGRKYAIWEPSGDQKAFIPPSITFVKSEPSGANV